MPVKDQEPATRQNGQSLNREATSKKIAKRTSKDEC